MDRNPPDRAHERLPAESAGTIVHVRLSVALLLGCFLVSASPGIAAQGVDGIAHAQPKIVPAEFNGDVRTLPMAPSGVSTQRPYLPLLRPPPPMKVRPLNPEAPAAPEPPIGPRVPMPSPIQNFAGLNFSDACTGGQCGAGWPPDINGDVGPNHYIEAVNDAIAIYSKTGTLLASFTENSLWASAALPPCTGKSQGDPVVIYDWLADRWWFSPSGPLLQKLFLLRLQTTTDSRPAVRH